jgi:hypothetical protein
MSMPFTPSETRYLISWAIEDHLASTAGPARTLQRQHGVHAAVLGQLFARLATILGRTQMEIVESPPPEGPVKWPWPTREVFEARLRQLLPESTMLYLQEVGALTHSEVPSL